MLLGGVLILGTFAFSFSIEANSNLPYLFAGIAITAIFVLTYKQTKAFLKFAESFYMEFTDNLLISINRFGKTELDLSTVEKVRLQYRGTNLRSVILKLDTDTRSKFEHIESIATFAYELQKRIEPNKIYKAKLFHF